jgi:hypothetical protein
VIPVPPAIFKVEPPFNVIVDELSSAILNDVEMLAVPAAVNLP